MKRLAAQVDLAARASNMKKIIGIIAIIGLAIVGYVVFVRPAPQSATTMHTEVVYDAVVPEIGSAEGTLVHISFPPMASLFSVDSATAEGRNILTLLQQSAETNTPVRVTVAHQKDIGSIVINVQELSPAAIAAYREKMKPAMQLSDENDTTDNSRFTSQLFKTISDTIVYDHVDTVATPPSITGDADVDAYLQKKAEERGYQLRHQADESRLVDVGGKKLQPEAAESLKALQAAAKKEGMTITFVSGYRSVADQRRIVLNKLGTYDKDALLAGKLDSKIDDILVVSSMPGYSKHHTGYTVDIACGNYDLSNAFMQTPCYQWLSKNNFANARAYNFVPSYPKGIANQGPNPESWEFIWVPDSYLE